jgi:probable HAF family extracellular repeat protein
VGNVGFPTKGYLYSKGAFTSLQVAGFDQTTAQDINNAGQIVGTFANFSELYIHSYVYSGGSFTPVDYPGAAVPGNSWFTEVTSINDAGIMAGFMRDQSALMHLSM